MAETAGIHLRESRAHAREIKFVVDAARGLEVQAWMRANLAPDEFGSGPDHERLEELAHRKGVAGRVIFTGQVPLDVLPHHFRAGDVFAMPNRSRKLGLEVEAFGIAFIEAAAVGRPGVAGDSGGAPEAVIHGETGLVVDGREIDQVADAIIELLVDPRQAMKLGMAGAGRVHSDFTWEARSARLRDLLIEALARG